MQHEESKSDVNETAAEASAAVGEAELHTRQESEDDRLEQLAVNTIRFLAVDAVEAAKSGHPGTPMGLADIAYVLWTDFLHHDPKDPKWKNRDRFVLSAGHASMLLYSLLHLTGYPDMTLDQLKNFRQWGSKTAGHPEYGHASGIEVTTGPLGQGFAHAVGMGLAAKMLAARFNSEDRQLVDHFVYAICSDGDLMEGISSEAGSIAGHLGLGNLIYFYDDNQISIEGPTRLSFSEDVKKRFESYGWHVLHVDGHDRNAIRKVIRKAQKIADKPKLIIARTIIGWGSPKLHGTAKAHGEPLGKEETAATKEALGWPAEPAFYVPDSVRELFLKKTKKLARSRKAWEKMLAEWRTRNPQLAEEWDRYWDFRQLPADAIPQLVEAAKSDKAIATRALSGQVIQKLSQLIPNLVGGSADLAPSTNTLIKDAGSIERQHEDAPPPPQQDVFKGRNLHFGIREHAMSAMVNGMTLYGCWRAYGATFLIFSDYARPSIRLAALMNIPSIFVYTHDSVFLGEDGPTHQPIEHLFALRLIPNLNVFRPADGPETAMAWAYAVGESHGPTAIILTRQKLDPLPHGSDFDPETILRGAYVLDAYRDGDITIVATGSETSLAVKSAEALKTKGIQARVVSAPCLELFDKQDIAYQNDVLGTDRSKVVAIEAGRSNGWYRYVNHDALVIGIDRFGASAPYEVIAEHLGFTPEQVAESVQEWLGRQPTA